MTLLALYSAKATAAVLDYGYDFGPELVENEPTDRVTSVSLSTEPPDLGASAISATPQGLVTFWLEGGRRGSTYLISIAVTTAAGRVIVATPAPLVPVV